MKSLRQPTCTRTHAHKHKHIDTIQSRIGKRKKYVRTRATDTHREKKNKELHKRPSHNEGNHPFYSRFLFIFSFFFSLSHRSCPSWIQVAWHTVSRRTQWHLPVYVHTGSIINVRKAPLFASSLGFLSSTHSRTRVMRNIPIEPDAFEFRWQRSGKRWMFFFPVSD